MRKTVFEQSRRVVARWSVPFKGVLSMKLRSTLVLGVAAVAWGSLGVGCSASGGGLEVDSSTHTGTGGSGQGGTGGASGDGGKVGSGGATSSGGQVGSGGTPGSGGKVGSGGATSSGGQVGSGGATSAGGAAGGSSGTPDAGRRTDSGSRPDVAGPATGGCPGAGGSSAAGGSSGAGGALAPGVFPKKFFGNIDTNGSIRTDFKTMWDQFTPENAGKWGSVQGGGSSSWSWSALDAQYKYTQDNGILFKEHCFAWGAQQPSWVNSSNGTTAIKTWMKTLCDRYPKVAVIDVVNEALHNTPAYRDGIGGTGTTGYDWIVNAFKWAKEACPNAILVYNDYNTIEYSSENNGVIKLAKAVLGGGAPLMAIGAQAHDIAKVSGSTVKTYTNNIITQTGLPVYITEMDIGLADDSQQLAIMKDLVTDWWGNENIKGVTYWGYIVGATWRSNTGLMTSSGSKRTALTWLMSFLGR
jgi:endo-1,4-beta-xylanase